MSDLPDSIRIGPIDFALQERHGLTGDGGTEKVDGHIKYGACQILIEASNDPQNKRQIVWHEVIHGILTQGQIVHDEKTVDLLAYGIMQVLRDNPWLRGPE